MWKFGDSIFIQLFVRELQRVMMCYVGNSRWLQRSSILLNQYWEQLSILATKVLLNFRKFKRRGLRYWTVALLISRTTRWCKTVTCPRWLFCSTGCLLLHSYHHVNTTCSVRWAFPLSGGQKKMESPSSTVEQTDEVFHWTTMVITSNWISGNLTVQSHAGKSSRSTDQASENIF